MKNFFLKVFLLYVFYCVKSASGEVDIQTKIIPQEGFIGDEITYIIDILRPKDSIIRLMEEKKKKEENFEIIGPYITEKKIDKENILTKFTYKIRIFKTGSVLIEPIKFESIYQGDKKIVQSKQMTVYIKSLINNQNKNLDIKGPKPNLEIKGHTLWWTLVLILILLFLLVSLWIYFKKRTINKNVAEITACLNAREEALNRLESLRLSNEYKEKNVKAIYIIMTEIMRRYFEKKYHFQAMDMTTIECIRVLKLRRVAYPLYENIKEWLMKCDLVKFAKYIPDKKIIDEHINQAKEIISKTWIE